MVNRITADNLMEYKTAFQNMKNNNSAFWRMPGGVWTPSFLASLEDVGLSQGNSGYCWLISFLNCVDILQKKQHYPCLKPSVNSLVFYDKLEKANWFLNHITQNHMNRREQQYLLNTVCNDQGHWDMAAHLIQKYGVPVSAEGEPTIVKDTARLNDSLKLVLRTYACCLKTEELSRPVSLQNEIQDILYRVFFLLASFLGMPHQDQLKRSSVEEGSLEERVLGNSSIGKFLSENYISISCIPGHPYHTLIKVLFDGNIEEYSGNLFLNLPEEEFYEAVRFQVKRENFCYIGCDSKCFTNHKVGIWDENSYIFPKWVDLNLYKQINRDQRLRYGLMKLSHAVVLCKRVQADDRLWWIAKNTFGEEYGEKGYTAISDLWLRKYVIHAVVRKEFLHSVKQIKEIHVKPWELSGKEL